MTQLTDVLIQIGESGLDEPLYGGFIILGIVGVSVVYLAFVRDEFEGGRLMKIGGVLLVLGALLSLFWPYRPW